MVLSVCLGAQGILWKGVSCANDVRRPFRRRCCNGSNRIVYVCKCLCVSRELGQEKWAAMNGGLQVVIVLDMMTSLGLSKPPCLHLDDEESIR